MFKPWFKLIPCIIILLMILRRINHFSEDDFEVFDALPTEYIKTNSFLSSPQIMPTKGVRIFDLRKKISRGAFERIKKSELAFLIKINEEEREDLKYFFDNDN